MNQPLIAACLTTFVVLFTAFIVVLERILDRREENKK